MTIFDQEAMRRKAMTMQAQYFPAAADPGRPAGDGGGGNRSGNPPAAGAGADGKKVAKSSAAARAPRPPEAAQAIPEHLRTKPNRRENEFMLNLMVLRNTLKMNAPACRERARLAGKWVWRDIRLMLTLVNRIQTAMLRTMPESRDEYYSAYARHGHYEMHIDGPLLNPRHLLITDKHLAAMAEAAMKSECILCMREGSEVGKCPLREALLEAAPPSELQEGLWRKCEYRDAAGQLIQGKDATV